jgi:hypothetical protein
MPVILATQEAEIREISVCFEVKKRFKYLSEMFCT